MESKYLEVIREICKEGLNKTNLKQYNEIIKETEKYIKEKIAPYADILKAVFIGNTNCGKSSLLCCLLKKQLLIKGDGKIVHLEGEGIGIGLESFTTIPIIESIKEGDILVDSPGFEDVKGYPQEILNEFSINGIFKKYSGNNNNFKIMLVVSTDEFDTNRGIKMVNSLLNLEKRFPTSSNLIQRVGIVVTKGDIDYEGNDYFKFLKEKINETKEPSRDLVRICDYFLNHKNQVFVFPKPSWKNKNQQYDFEDHNRLIEFIHTNPLVNPKHHITLSTEAQLKLQIIREDHLKKLSKSIKKLCDKINNQFANESKSSELQKWYDIIYNLLQEDIQTSKELGQFLKKNIPNSEQFTKDLEDISEYELFDEFIDSILYLKINTSCLNEVIQAWCKHAVDELHKSVFYAQDSENTKEKLEEQRKFNEKIKVLEDLIKQKDDDIQRIINEYLEEIKKQNQLHKENLEQIKILQNNIARLEQESRERSQTIAKLQSDLARERNKQPQVIVKKRCLLI